jgi:hypothetical protein
MTSRTAIAIATTSWLLAATAAKVDAGAKLMLKVSPSVSSAPSTVVVRALVPKDADNRTLLIGADSGTFYRSSEIQLDGARAPFVTELRLKDLPGGEYTVVAVLRDQMGHQTTVKQTILILSRFGEP